MADALMEYETIDSLQIDDIMAGKPPRPPQDSGDSASKGGPGVTPADKETKAAEGKIGGTASEH